VPSNPIPLPLEPHLYFTERGSGPPLLLVHGLMVTGEMFEPVIERFATKHRVIVPDLRGHGRSRGFPPPYTTSQLAYDLSRLLDVLGIGSIEGHLFPLFVQVFGIKTMAKIVFSLGAKGLSKERATWLASIMATQNQELMVSAWREAMAFDSRHRLTEIRCPALIIAGSNDDAVPIHHAEMLHNSIAGSQLVIIDGADHALIWTHANELTQVTDDFLGTLNLP
jgi:pimeloyl-ACP methyl ester carboxylesterase